MDQTGGLKVPVELVALKPYLRVDYDVESGIIQASWAGRIISRAHLLRPISDWTTVEVRVKPKTDEMELFISNPEGESAFGVVDILGDPPAHVDEGHEYSLSVGPMSHQRRVLTLAAVRYPPTPRGVSRSKRSVYSMDRGANISAINFEGTNGFVRFDFRNRIKLPKSDAEVGREEVALDFVLKPGVTSGLLWFAEGTASKSFIIIKVSAFESKYILSCENLSKIPKFKNNSCGN